MPKGVPNDNMPKYRRAESIIGLFKKRRTRDRFAVFCKGSWSPIDVHILREKEIASFTHEIAGFTHL